jgi:hypothetical protein
MNRQSDSSSTQAASEVAGAQPTAFPVSRLESLAR